jgi:hypothetical protein
MLTFGLLKKTVKKYGLLNNFIIENKNGQIVVSGISLKTPGFDIQNENKI